MSKRLLIAGLAALCALAVSAVAASGASATATAYTVGSPTAIPAGEETGLALDATTNWILVSSQFGATIELVAERIDCVECMAHNQASPMDVTGTGGRLLYTEVRVGGAFEENCTVEDTSIPAPLTKTDAATTERLEVTASEPGSAVLRPVNAAGETIEQFATIIVVAKPGKTCSIAGSYVVTGAGVTGTVSGDVLSINSTTELKMNKKAVSLTGSATITAGVTGGTYHPVELKSS